MDDKPKALARPAASRALREAIRRARIEEAERLDRTADKRDAELARLELLKAELAPVFAEIPSGDDRFELALVPSNPVRLWIDLFTYVTVEDDGTYVLVRNSDHGRKTLFHSGDIGDMADRITLHLARAIVRREREEGGYVELPRSAEVEARGSQSSRASVVMLAFLIGLITGAAGLFAAVWLSVP